MGTRGNLFIISAPSGAGKSSLFGAILQHNPDHIKGSISHTTRDPRGAEVDGKHYHFVSVKKFKELIEQQAFFEWAQVFGNYYGTSRAAVDTMLNQGVDVLLDIDWQGAQQVKKAMPEAVGVFILPPSKKELRRRLDARGQDSAEVINTRIAQATEDISHYNEFDYLIVNDNFDHALEDLKAIIRSQHLRCTGQIHAQNDILGDLLAEKLS